LDNFDVAMPKDNVFFSAISIKIKPIGLYSQPSFPFAGKALSKARKQPEG